jgi:predicted nucleic acid-binding protein
MAERFAVVDASLVIKTLLPNPDLLRCQTVLSQLNDRQLVAPSLWIYEITSVLTKAVHFNQLTPQEAQAVLNQIMTLGVQVILPDETQAQLAFELALNLKRAAAYDCFYLVVAEALNADLWTADKRLIGAFQEMKPEWLHWVGEMD